MNTQSWQNWNQAADFTLPSLKQRFVARSDAILPLFARCNQLTETHKGQYICGFFSQPGIVGPIGDILTEFYRQEANRPEDSHILFPKRNENCATAAEFIAKNPVIDDMFTPEHRDNLVAITLSFFRDMRAMDSAMDFFLRNSCGRNESFNPRHHLNAERVKAIIIEDVIEKEFGLDPANKDYQKAKPELQQAIEKIISLTSQHPEGIVNFIAIPRVNAEDRERSAFYPSVSKGVPVKLSPDPAERKRFYDALQSAPHELKVEEAGSSEPVCPQGRLLRGALSSENQQIKVVRLTTMTPMRQAQYRLRIQALVGEILKIVKNTPT